MMQSIKVTEGQTLTDIAMQYCGDALRVFDVADLNALSITDEIVPGQILLVPDIETDKIKIASVYNNEIIPASKDTDEGIDKPDGIDYWYVEDDFIVIN